MFKIRGSDGKEYGPGSAEQLRQWIREGRAGGTTPVQRVGESAWAPLRELPEFADVFCTPALISGDGGFSIPPLVRLLAKAMFAVAGISAVMLLVNLLSLRFRAGQAFNPGFIYYLHCGVAALSVPARIAAGIGLLRGRRWAWSLAIGLAGGLALYGGWGQIQMVRWWASHPEVFPGLWMSPMYLLSVGWSLAVLLFNVATIVLLCRKDVRSVFARKSAPAP